jgi:hypothetical protein
MARPLPLHERSRNAPELVIDERHELVEDGGFPLAQPLQQERDLGRHLLVA